MVQRDWFCLGVRLIGIWLAIHGLLMFVAGIALALIDVVVGFFDRRAVSIDPDLIPQSVYLNDMDNPIFINMLGLITPIVYTLAGWIIARRAEQITGWFFRPSKSAITPDN